MFTATDVIEILMVDGTLKLENFIPIQIGKLFFIHAVSFGYLEDIGAYCTLFLSLIIIIIFQLIKYQVFSWYSMCAAVSSVSFQCSAFIW